MSSNPIYIHIYRLHSQQRASYFKSVLVFNFESLFQPNAELHNQSKLYIEIGVRPSAISKITEANNLDKDKNSIITKYCGDAETLRPTNLVLQLW